MSMSKMFLRQLNPNARLVQCSRTGIAWVEYGSTGMRYSPHPNISATGSVRGMKQCGYWGKNDRTVRTHGFIYNIDHAITGDPFSQAALTSCSCGGNHGQKKRR